MLYMAMIGAVVMGAIAPFQWVAPDPGGWVGLVALGVVGIETHRLAELSGRLLVPSDTRQRGGEASGDQGPGDPGAAGAGGQGQGGHRTDGNTFTAPLAVCGIHRGDEMSGVHGLEKCEAPGSQQRLAAAAAAVADEIDVLADVFAELDKDSQETS